MTVTVAALSLWTWRSAEQLLPGAFRQSWGLLLPDLVVAALVGLVVGTVVVLLARLAKWRLPWLVVCAVVFAAVLMLTTGAGASLTGWVTITVVTLAAATGWGWWLGGVPAQGARRGRAPSVALGAVTLISLVVVGFLAWPGVDGGGTVPAEPRGTMADPTVPGPYPVVSTSYGSGTYQAEAAYGADVPIRTPSVDASTIIGGWDAGSTRSGVWGFTAAALPLNARVWAPQGAGPFPLVLILHGNSPFTESETGFVYLGTLLASRGYLVASVDENFLNTGLLDKANPITGADTARAWLLLEHLHQWRTFDDTPGNPFTGKVDLSDVSLVGHSRGGEAVAVAAGRRAELSRLSGAAPGHTSDADVRIRTVVALAPSDGQYDPRTPVQLAGTSYLTMGGTDDADVSTFAGARQYARTSLEPTPSAPGPGEAGPVKAAVSVGRANHTQFNTRWGRHDVGLGAAKYTLGTAELLRPAEQQQVAKAYISAFLDMTMKGDGDQRPLFDGSVTGMSWLPATVYRQQYADSSSDSVQTFEDGADSPPAPVGTVTVTGAPSGPVPLPTRTGPSTNRALPLAWQPGADTAQYSIADLAPRALTPRAVLTADLANTGPTTLPVQVKITDAAGRSTTVPFGDQSNLAAEVNGSVLKPPLPGGTVAEPLLQTFRLPLNSVRGVDPATLTAITITFAGNDGGSVYLDNVGVTLGDP